MPRVAPLVFLASTTQDLEAHRAAIHRALLGLDVLYRGMEYFGSRPMPTRNVIMDELVSCDLFIGVVAFRYGSVDPESGLSYTELEYQAAIDARIPSLMFLMDTRNPVPEIHREGSHEGRDRLDGFRKRLTEARVIEWFSTPEDLAVRVSQSLQRWIDETKSQWRLTFVPPLNEFENRYVCQLHSRKLSQVKHAIECLESSSNRIALEHLYAVLYWKDLPEEIFRDVVLSLISSPDEPRVSQMLVNLARDIHERRLHTLFAIGHRGLSDGRTVSDEELRCVLDHERDPDPNVRAEVAHALGKFLKRRKASADECFAALIRLGNDPDEIVRQRVRQAEQGLAIPRANHSRGSS